jgi:hypothetical protein
MWTKLAVPPLQELRLMSEFPPGFDSTLIRRGSAASTFDEIAAFARMIEERPIATLLDDLSAIEFLSDTKFQIARRALRRRLRAMEEAELETVRAHLAGLEGSNPTAADRLRLLVGVGF